MAIRVKDIPAAKDGNFGESPLSLVVKVHFSSGKSPPPKNGVKNFYEVKASGFIEDKA